MGIVVNLKDDAKKPSSIDSLSLLIKEDLKDVNKIIVTRMASKIDLIPKLAGHIVAAGGKRIRPMLTLSSAKLCGYKGDRHLALAACVEFIHTATLLHDDVVDTSILRRGESSANLLFGNQASVLVGDFLFSRAFQMMVEDGSLDVLRILSHASSVIAEGEVLQLTTVNNTETGENIYLEVIKSKTAQLFAAACEVGAVIAKRPAIEQRALETYGINLGITFQLVDDVLDYTAKQGNLGKTIGDDFREGKVSLPVILAFSRGTSEERQFWRRTLESLDQTDTDLEYAIKLMSKHDALSDAIKRARHYGSIARDSLGIFDDNPIRSSLVGLIDFCIERAN